MSRTIERIDRSSPPGVSSRITRAAAPSARARSIAVRDEADGDGADHPVDLEGRHRLRARRRGQREHEREAGQETAGDRPTPPTASHWSGCIIARHGDAPRPRPRRPRPLRLGRDRSALPRVSRPRVGRAAPRRPAPLRAPLPRGRAGGPRLDHDPPEARGLPARLRPLRSPEGGRATARPEDPRAPRRSRHRPQPPQGPGRRPERPRLPRAPGGARHASTASSGASSAASRGRTPGEA